MTSENSIDASVLRQTCDRCRKLKVRCQQGPFNPDAQRDSPGTCTRCSKAGAKCTFSAPHRSGRPPTNRHGRVWSVTGAKVTKQSPSSPRRPSSNSDTSSDVSLGSISPSSEKPWPTPWFDFNLNSFEFDQFQPEAPSTSGSLPLAWDAPIDPESILDLAQETCGTSVDDVSLESILSSCANQTNDEEDRVSRRSIAEDVKGLSDLNIHIHEMAESATMAISSEELTYVTCRMLKAFGKIVETPTQKRECRALSSTSCDFADGLERRFIEAEIHRTEGSSSTGVLDTGTFLMVLTSYHGLLNLFKQVFISIHKTLAQDGLASHEKPTGHDYMVIDEDDFENDCLRARAVMITELINHLLDRVERGFRQFMATLGSRKNTTSSAEPTTQLHDLDSSPSSTDSGLPPQANHARSCTPPTSHRSGKLTEDVLMLVSSPADLGARSLIESMARKQQLLYDHVGIIKQTISQGRR